MVARPGVFQASINAGELKPEMQGRTDVKQFYAGLAYARNVEPVPQGGGRLSPRSRFLGTIRKLLATVATNSSAVHAGPFTDIAELGLITFATPQRVNVVSIPSLAASQPLGAIIQVEWSNGVTFASFGSAFAVGTSAVKHTIALPPGQFVTAAGVRVRMVSAPPSSTTFTISSIVAEQETANISAVRLRPFTFGLDQTYVAVFTANHVDFYRDGVFVGSSKTNFSSDNLALINTQQRFDTMLMFNEAVKSQRILRNASETDWILDSVPFENIPSVDLGGTYTNQVTDIWQVYINYPTSGAFAAGINLFLSFNVSGEETAGVPTGASVNWTTFAAAVKAAIEGLPSISPGITVTEDHSTAGLTTLTISFTGSGNNGVLNTMSAQVVNTSAAAATVTHTQLGVPGGEPIISDAAGYAACGNFYQERLVTGGFKSKRGAMLASVAGEYFDNNTTIISAAGAILSNLDTDGAERLHHIARARNLMLFTTDAEYFINDRTLNRTVTPTIVNASRNGSAPQLPIVENENSLLYVNFHRTILYAATYDDVGATYLSEPISLLASHIASEQADMALQKSSSATDAARLWQVRDDGTMCCGIMLRNQDVTAFVRWETPGDVQAVCVDGINVAHIAVERTVAGVTGLHFERLELGLIFDGTVEQTFDDPVTVVPNLGMHESAEVWAQADGYVVGPFTVAGGSITLPDAAAHVLVGRWTPPNVVPLPLPSEVADGVVLKRPKRVHTVRIDAINTTSLAVGANGRPAKDVGLFRAGDLADAPLAPVTREIVVTGLTGFSPGGQIEITQLKPGLLAWTGFTREARK